MTATGAGGGSAGGLAANDTAAKIKRSIIMVLLPIFGLLLLASALAFLWKAYQGGEIKDGVVALLLIGLATLLVVELLPMLQSLKLSKDGVELEFRTLGEKVTGDADALRDRIEALERTVAACKAEQPAPAKPVARASAKAASPPAATTPAPLTWDTPERLTKFGPYRDDQRKGVFGGHASVAGFTLSAGFDGPRDQAWCEVILTVTADNTANVEGVAGVEFFLHNSFPRSRVRAPLRNGQARIERTTWGGFTVGVWIPVRDITLELDLAELPYAPKIVKEL